MGGLYTLGLRRVCKKSCCSSSQQRFGTGLFSRECANFPGFPGSLLSSLAVSSLIGWLLFFKPSPLVGTDLHDGQEVLCQKILFLSNSLKKMMINGTILLSVYAHSYVP